MKPATRRFPTLVLLAALPLVATSAHAVTKVGNGDDGRDLEGFIRIEKGPIVDAKREAVKLVRSLNIPGVRGLGALLPELEDSKLYLTKKDSNAVESTDPGAFHGDMKGRVYARTFAEPHAATRFFPVAEKLEQDQLVALHIHEALHRALPEDAREDESIVSGITLAITSPEASFDTVDRAVAKLVPERDERVADGASETSEPEKYPVPDSARVKRPSEFSYSYRSYRAPKEASTFPVDSMHLIRTDLYPFGTDQGPIGIGIEAGLIQRPTGSFMGPLSLSARSRIWSARGFDVGVWGVASLNTLSAEELKNSQFGRDTYSLGLSMRKDLAFFSVENFLGYMGSGTSQQTIGKVPYTYDYGGVISASTHPAVLVGPFRIGGFAEFDLGDHYRVNGGAFSYDTGRYRIVSGGPEVSFQHKNFILGVDGRFIINTTKDASFDTLGDLMGPGAAQGNVTGTVSIIF
jgi:hypothetical protein